MQDHTTADDSSRYRTQKELEEWKKKDPIIRLQKFMKARKIWTQAEEKKLLVKIQKQVKEAVDKYLSYPPPNYEDMFKHTFATMPWNLKEQLAELKNILKEKESK